MKGDAYIAVRPQVDDLDEFAPQIREIVRHRPKVGFPPVPPDRNDQPKRARRLQKAHHVPYYLARFIAGGFMEVRRILDGRNVEALSERARIFFKRMILPPKTLELVIEAQRRGIDLDRILKEMLYPNPKS